MRLDQMQISAMLCTNSENLKGCRFKMRRSQLILHSRDENQFDSGTMTFEALQSEHCHCHRRSACSFCAPRCPDMRERGNEKKQRQSRGYQTVNAKSMDESELNVHEVQRERHTCRRVDNRAQMQAA